MSLSFCTSITIKYHLFKYPNKLWAYKAPRCFLIMEKLSPLRESPAVEDARIWLLFLGCTRTWLSNHEAIQDA